MHSFTTIEPPESNYIVKRIKIQPFKSNQKNEVIRVMTLIRSGIAKEGYIDVVGHGEECVISGYLNIGKIYKNSRSESYKCTKYNSDGDSYKSTCYTYYYTKKVTMGIDYTLYSNQDGKIVFGDSINYDFDKTWSSGDSRSEAKASALTDDQIINTGIQEVTMQIVKAVTPHKAVVSIELQEGDKNVKLGIKYLENGRKEQAISIWDQCIKITKSPKNKAAAYYNIGVIKESLGLYQDAFDLYSKANKLLPEKDIYIESMTRVERLYGKMENIESWNK